MQKKKTSHYMYISEIAILAGKLVTIAKNNYYNIDPRSFVFRRRFRRRQRLQHAQLHDHGHPRCPGKSM
jgi:hypothetical protein